MNVRKLPFILGIRSLWPGTYMSYIPDRYWDNAAASFASGALRRYWDMGRFLRGNRMNNGGDLVRFYGLTLILEQIEKEGLEGDLAELGVYKGNTANSLALFARASNKKVFLFDTFGGFAAEDIRPIDTNKELLFSDTSVEGVRALVGSERVEYVVGNFPSTTSMVSDDLRLCLAHIDCDLYEPMRAGLEYFYPRLVPGGFMVLHDYNSRHWAGAEKAVDEFLTDKPERVVPLPDKSGTVVFRKSAR